MISNDFNDLGLSGPLVNVLSKTGITTPTEVQTKTIPPALAGRDIMASAETGSGKTAAFLLPIIERLKRPGQLRALVLVPTRELALQIEDTAKLYSRPRRLRVVSVVGGQNIDRQMRALAAGADILIATPGRLNDLIDRRAVKLGSIEILVLDEADRMLDMGFLPQVRSIIKHLPKERQTMLLTATLSRDVEKLARESMVKYVRVEAARSATTVATLTQTVYPVLSHAKTPMLLALLKEHKTSSFLVFTQTKRGADRVSQVLEANRLSVAILHSGRSQSQRNSALASFRSGQSRVLVATDVAARGIDVDNIAYVINYDVPSTAEDYIHRVGRTARAGQSGFAFTFVSPEEEPTLAMIERMAGVTLERSRLKGFSDGRSDEQIKLASEIARLGRPSSRSFSSNRAWR